MEPDTSDETNGQEFPGCLWARLLLVMLLPKGQLRCESAKKSKVTHPLLTEINGPVYSTRLTRKPSEV